MSCLNKLLILYFSIQIFSFPIYAQQNNDSLLSVVAGLAQEGDYVQANEIALRVMQSDSTRTDALVVIANLNFWMSKNDSALIWIQKADSLKATDDDFYSSYLNILLVNKDYEQLLKIAQRAHADNYSNAVNLLQKQLVAYQGLLKYKEAIELYDAHEDENAKEDHAVKALIEEILLKFQNNLISINYSIDMFSNRDPQHLLSFDFSYKPKINTHGFTINYASRFGLADLQVETTNYIYLASRHYMYLNYGLGVNAVLFPRHRIGLEYYFPISKFIEASLGSRFLSYSNTISEKVYILTGHLGGYVGDGWIGLRPFWVIKKDIQAFSVSLKYKHYGKSKFDYWGAELLVGNSPDDMYSITQSGFNDLQSYRARFEKSWMIDKTSSLFFAPSFGIEQYVQGVDALYRSRFTFDFGYRYKF